MDIQPCSTLPYITPRRLSQLLGGPGLKVTHQAILGVSPSLPRRCCWDCLTLTFSQLRPAATGHAPLMVRGQAKQAKGSAVLPLQHVAQFHSLTRFDSADPHHCLLSDENRRLYLLDRPNMRASMVLGRVRAFRKPDVWLLARFAQLKRTMEVAMPAKAGCPRVLVQVSMRLLTDQGHRVPYIPTPAIFMTSAER